MLGAIIGDICGSSYEFDNPVEPGYPLLRTHWNRLKTSKATDDSICTFAIMESLFTGKLDFADSLRRWGLKYNTIDYGGMFTDWLESPDAGPYNSWGNGAVMRVSPVAIYAKSDFEALELAEAQAAATHNHPNAIHAAKALVIAIRMADRGVAKANMLRDLETIFGYDLSISLDDLKRETNRKFDISAGGTIRLALVAVLNANTFEEAIRNCIDLGGDTDTTAAVGGGLAERLFHIPNELKADCYKLLDERMQDLIENFYALDRLNPSAVSIVLDTSIQMPIAPIYTSENKLILTANAEQLKKLTS